MFNQDELKKIIAKFADAEAEKKRLEKEANKELYDQTKENVLKLKQDFYGVWHAFVEKHKDEFAGIMEISKGVHEYIDSGFDYSFNITRDDKLKPNLLACTITKNLGKKYGMVYDVYDMNLFTNVLDKNLRQRLYNAMERVSSMEQGDYFIVDGVDGCIMFPIINTKSNLLILSGEFYSVDIYLNSIDTEKYDYDLICHEGIVERLLALASSLSDTFEEYKNALDKRIRNEEEKFDKERTEKEKRKKLMEKKNEAKRLEDELKKTQEEILQMENSTIEQGE